MLVVSIVISAHISHVIAHPFQLHGCSKEVELMKAVVILCQNRA